MSLHSSLQEMRKYRFPALLVFVFCMMATLSFLAARGMRSTLAAPVSGFNPGNIISDAMMANYNSMTKDDIQRFLSSKNNCNNTNYQQYLNLKAQYPNTDWHFENGHFVCLSEERFGDGITIGSGQTAAEIIYQAAQDYRINPQVLIVLLQKEQGLITDTYPNSKQYRSATGYGCPDSAPCNAEYYGFKNQVRKAAVLFRTVLDGGWSNYPAGRVNYIQYHYNSACGGTQVYIENRATSALYRYTPYQPNASALNAGYGTGDACGAYGNRNFYLYFRDWFGSTQVVVNGTATTIPDGTYSLMSKYGTNQTMDIAGGGTANTTNIQIANRAQSASHTWNFKRNDNGFYTITDVKSGRALDLNGGLTHNGANIQLYDANTTCSQQWKVYQTPDHYLTIESACSAGMVLDVNGLTNSVQLWLTNSSDPQKWSIYTDQTLANGYYNIHHAAANGKAMEVAGGMIVDSANIQTWAKNETIAQKWYISYNSATGDYSIINPRSGKGIDLNGGIIKDSTNVQLYTANTTCAQRWDIIPTGGNNYTFVSACSPNFVLDVNGLNGNIQGWSANNSLAQKWTLSSIPVLADGTYIIQSRMDSNKLINITGAAVADGTNVDLWSNINSDAQKWDIKYNAQTGFYTITNHFSKKSIDLNGGIKTDGNNIHSFAPNTTCSQNWRIIPDEYNHYTIYSACRPDGVVDAYGGLSADGTNIQLFQTNETNAQKWDFIKQ